MARSRGVEPIVRALACAGLLAAMACTGEPAPGRGAAQLPGSDGTSEARLAPDFTLEDLAGRHVRLSDSTGRIRLIDFWATWCAPCREEIPMLKELNALYRERGLEILAISDSTDSASAVREYATKQGIDYTNLLGTDDVAQLYTVLGLPTAFLVDREGRVVETFVGPKPRKILESKIQELLTSS